jgi:hypothetical protein
MDLLLRDESFRSECPQLHSRAGNQTFRSRPTPPIGLRLIESPSWVDSVENSEIEHSLKCSNLTTSVAVLLSVEFGALVLLLGAQVIVEYERVSCAPIEASGRPLRTEGSSN